MNWIQQKYLVTVDVLDTGTVSEENVLDTDGISCELDTLDT